MPQLVQCPSCNKQLNAPDAAYGKRVRCPQCSNPVSVPAQPGANASPSGQFQPQQAYAPPQGHIQAQPTTTPAGAVQQPPQYQQHPQLYQQHPQQQYPQQPMQGQPQYPPQQYPQQQYPQPQGHYQPQPGQYPQPQGQQYPPPQQYDDGYDREPPDEGDYGDEDQPRRKKSKKASRSDWSRVRSGVTYVLIGILVLIGVWIFAFLGMMVIAATAMNSMTTNIRPGMNPNIAAANAANTATNMGFGMIAMLVFMVLGFLSSVVLTVLGNIFCIKAPAAAGARVLAITSLSLLIAGVALYLLQWVIQIFTLGMAASMSGFGGMGAMATGFNFSVVVGLLGMVAFFAHLIVFQLLLRALAVALRRNGLASSIMAMMITGGVGILFFLLTFFVAIIGASSTASATNAQQAMQSANSTMGMIGVSMCLSGLLLFTWFIWYIVSLIMVRSSITDKIG